MRSDALPFLGDDDNGEEADDDDEQVAVAAICAQFLCRVDRFCHLFRVLIRLFLKIVKYNIIFLQIIFSIGRKDALWDADGAQGNEYGFPLVKVWVVYVIRHVKRIQFVPFSCA